MAHRQAVVLMISIPSATGDIGEMLFSQYANQRKSNMQALLQIFIGIKFLCCQGLALKGDGTEVDGNLQQILRMKAKEDPNLAQWLKRKQNVYTSPEIQNEVIKLMGVSILRKVVADCHVSPFLTIMADETTDVSNQEQVTLFVRWVTEDFEVREEFLGLYSVASIDADTLVSVIKDVFLRLNLSFDRVRGQCYDGASAMSGSKSGVAKQISTTEPRAIYTHCYGHALNLAASDSIKKSKVMKDALDTTHEICKLITPKRSYF